MTTNDFEYYLGAYARLLADSGRGPQTFSPSDFVTLKNASARIRGCNERECNGYADDDYGRRREARDAAMSKRMAGVARYICTHKLGLQLHIQGDPRGPSFIIGDKDSGVRL